jgi:hypothetical protein
MSNLTFTWLEDWSPRDLLRWVIAGAVVIGEVACQRARFPCGEQR